MNGVDEFWELRRKVSNIGGRLTGGAKSFRMS